MSNDKFDIDGIRDKYPLPDFVSSSGIKLRASGNEFWACCPFHGEKTSSFHIFPSNQSAIYKYHCFGCGASGDVIDYAQELYGTDFKGAVEIITGETVATAKPLSYKEIVDPYAGYDFRRPPEDQSPIKPNEKTPPILNPKRVNSETGKPKVVQYTPSMVFPYKDRKGLLLGYVLRVEFDDKKITPGVWWMKNHDAKFTGWSHGSYPEPRPLYGLDRLHKNPDHQVLLVEGEKCADAGERLLAEKKIVSVSWMGGGKAIAKVHWKSLAGRSILIWPDNDKPGWSTVMGDVKRDKDGEPIRPIKWVPGLVERLYAANVKRIKIVHITPDSREKGWDIADAEKEGLGTDGVSLIIRDRIRHWSRDKFEAWKADKLRKADPVPENNVIEHQSNPQSDEPPAPSKRHFEIDGENWRNHLIFKADGDGIRGTSLQNINLIMTYDNRFSGLFAWNEFATEVYVMRKPVWDQSEHTGKWVPRMITDNDISSATAWLEYTGLSPKRNDVGSMIMVVAKANAFNPVTEKLESLSWDGVPRLFGGQTNNGNIPCMLTYYFGSEQTRANMAFGGKWMIGAVARAFKPGCKMDTMIILEGNQGIKKSTALKVLSDAVAPDLFTDQIDDPNSKDAALQLQGSFIVEIAELDAFRRAEISQIKAWVSRMDDRFRRPYGKIIEKFPRSCVFAGTVNPSGTGYLKDATGARRFWPVKCDGIDLDAIKSDAIQLWAEAVKRYKDGEIWWLEGEDQKAAHEAQLDRYEVDPWAQMINDFADTQNRVTLHNVMAHLEIPKERRSNLTAKRIGDHLHSKGWTKTVSHGRVVYLKPEVDAVSQE
ncbi:VapE domain-containing protein [uncultured Paraglaciecola sp.]|uniref:VapE domain-containing protein n=1 Tax=uncultured Paraglaciecola sp. TaxID=1765024 RepID=UPI0026130E2C|nr:VapE domain-containing protein [uncultured Paraglaciecola sp.]